MTDLEKKVKEFSEAVAKAKLSAEQASELLSGCNFGISEETKRILEKLRNIDYAGYKPYKIK